MTAKRAIEDYLEDIVAYADKAMEFLRGVPTPAALAQDEKTLLATVRALEVIGEAARHAPKSFASQHPEVPWRAMIGMRDKVIHGYFGVDEEVVWKTVKEDLPPVRSAVARILEGLRLTEDQHAQADQGPS